MREAKTTICECGRVTDNPLGACNRCSSEIVNSSLAEPYTVTETAAKLGITPVAVRAAIKRAKLGATKLGRDYAIDALEIERYRRESLGKRGAPAARGLELYRVLFQCEDNRPIVAPSRRAIFPRDNPPSIAAGRFFVTAIDRATAERFAREILAEKFDAADDRISIESLELVEGKVGRK